MQPAERFLGRQQLQIPRSRLHLRIEVEPPADPVSVTWIKLVAPDRREVVVRVVPDPDGVTRVPAFDAGPYRRVEVSTDRGGAVVRNVAFGGDPIPVTVRRRMARHGPVD